MNRGQFPHFHFTLGTVYNVVSLDTGLKGLDFSKSVSIAETVCYRFPASFPAEILGKHLTLLQPSSTTLEEIHFVHF